MGTTVSTQLVYHGEKRDRIGRLHIPAARRQQLLALFRESGLTRQAFARREGVRYTTFCTWVQRAPKRATPAASAVPGAAPSPPPAAPVMRFAEVSLPPHASAAPPVSPAAGLLEVRLPDGTSLRGERADALAALARALRA
jgi:transposase-like protein